MHVLTGTCMSSCTQPHLQQQRWHLSQLPCSRQRLTSRASPRSVTTASAAQLHSHVTSLAATLQAKLIPIQKHLGAVALSTLLLTGAAQAADIAETGQCLLANCKIPLAECLGDSGCAQNLYCLQRCNGRADETECQVRCTQLHENEAVMNFNKCAVSEHGCVKQKVSTPSEPQGFGPPPKEALDENFDINRYTGKWYISAGLNSAFDIFPCQDHYFAVPEPGKMDLKLNWRIPMDEGHPEGKFAERSDTQNFVQAKDEKAHLINDNNDFMNYRDDWYIIASKPEAYLFVLYNGNNDAWKGYGGSTVYTRARELPQKYEKELAEAAKKANLDWSKFTRTDNSCHPPET